jgi:hypothetical protein
VPLEAAVVRRLVQQPDGWSWVPGIESVDLDARELQLSIRGPRVLRARLAVTLTPSGLTAELVEGDLKSLTLRVVVEDCGEGRCKVELGVKIIPPYPVPGTLVREFEEVTVGRWVLALDAVTQHAHPAGAQTS